MVTIDYAGIYSWKNYFVGLIAGAIFLVLNSLIPILGMGILPQIALGWTQASQLLLIVIVAPILEEVFFVYILYNTTNKILRSALGFGGTLLAVLIIALGFSIYHLNAYGVGLVAAFVGAFAFRIYAIAWYEWRHDLIVPIGAHMFFNGVYWGVTFLSFGVMV